MPESSAAALSLSRLPTEVLLKILVYTRTTNYPHESIPAGVRTIQDIGVKEPFDVSVSNDPLAFRNESLRTFDVVVFLNNSGDILDEEGKLELQRYVRSGRGIVGIHGAAATMEEWPWYVGLIGATFKSHPEIQTARVTTVNRTHPATAHLPGTWMWEEEWYNFQKLSPDLRVLLSVDETTYRGGENGAGHPIAWVHECEGSRVFYTAIGHLSAAFADAGVREHLRGGILWAGGGRWSGH